MPLSGCDGDGQGDSVTARYRVNLQRSHNPTPRPISLWHVLPRCPPACKTRSTAHPESLGDLSTAVPAQNPSEANP